MATNAKALSRAALFATGALTAYLRPKMAQDAQIDVAAALADVTGKNFAAKKDAIAAAVEGAAKGKMAQDASLSDLAALLDGLAAAVPAMDEEPGPKDRGSKGAEDDEDEDYEEKKRKKAEGASDEDDDEAEEKKKEEERKAAMDAAIGVAVKAAEKRAEESTIARLNAIREAERAVRPYIGEIAAAMDSAEAIYKLALDAAGVDLTGAPPAAYPALLRMLPKPGDAPKARQRVAMDAAGVKSFAERYPHAASIKTI